MQKSFIKSICKIVILQVLKEEEGYEMDCLISEEFTPVPDMISVYEESKRLCEKHHKSWDEFIEGLRQLASRGKAYHWSLYVYAYEIIMDGYTNATSKNH